MGILDSLFGKKGSYQIYTYRTKDGVAYFKYSYHWIGTGYEIDIHQQPSYQNRDDDMHTTHLLKSPRDAKFKICVQSHATPRTLEKAQQLSKAFAEYTWEYIKTGVTIDSQVAMEARERRNSKDKNQ